MNGWVILGGGVAGLAAGYEASKYGYKAEIYELRSRWGGLLDNFKVGEFQFDHAVHLSFTNDKFVRSIFDQTEYISHVPQPYNYEQGKWLCHPVQTNLHPLSLQEKLDALCSFADRPQISGDIANYWDWLVAQYGTYIAERFPRKYTRKYWTVNPDKLNTVWVGNRMYRPELREVLEGAFGEVDQSRYYASEMRYPKFGGYKAFLNPLVDPRQIKLNKRAVRVNLKAQFVEFKDGERVYYDRLFSSMPLPQFIDIVDDVPLNVKTAAEGLWATSIALVSVGFNRPCVAKHLWFYIYDEEYLPARVYSPSLKSPSNVPAGRSSLQFEIYFSRNRPLNMSKEALVEHVVGVIEKMGIAEKTDITEIDCRMVPFGNVVFDHGMIHRRQVVRDFLADKRVHCIGRFGEWDYLWSDQSLISGRNAVESVLHREISQL